MADTAKHARQRLFVARQATPPGPGLRDRLLVVVSAVALSVAAVAAVSYVLIMKLEAQALAVYESRVVPTSALRTVSDSYAIDVVDTVHKVCAGHLDIAQGAQRVTRALAASAESWALYAARSSDAAAVRTAEPVLQRARGAALEAQQLMLQANWRALDEFRTQRMYPVIEPLTQHLARRVKHELALTDRLVRETRDRLRTLRVGASIVLVAVALLGWAYVARFSRSLARSISSVEGVVRKVAEGDLSVRSGAGVDEAFADMAADIDFMIDALERSHRERQAHHAQLAQAVEEAQSANAAKSLFLSSMSHEFRTPLNVILGYAQLLAREAERSASDRRALARVMQAGEHLLGLIDDVLSISKIEAGKLTLRPQSFETAVLIDAIHGMFAARALQKGLALRVERDASVPGWLHADAGRLRQILVNLLSNALKFTQQGQVHALLWYSAGRLHASVSDTGPGISQEELAHLFERFHQGAAGHRTSEGAGLGLYISRSLVRLMGGDLVANSTPGTGSVFTFDILAERGAADAMIHRPSRRLRLAAGTRCGPMLVVDDREDNREVLSGLLRQLGFVVDEACDGAAAVEACAQQTYAIVWMDLHMPKLSGEQALRRIHQTDLAAGRQPHKIVAVTASVIELDREGALREGFDELVGKPFSEHEVTDLIHQLLGVRFVEESPSIEDALPEAQAEATPSGLDELPGELRDSLLSALIAGDAAAARATLERVEPQRLSRALRAVVDSYAYDALISELRSVASRVPQLGAGEHA